MRYVIYYLEGWNSAPTFEKSVEVARLQIKSHYERTDSLGESYAVIYDKLNRSRWIVFKASKGETRLKKVY